jgi:hypothetical protein
MRQSGKLSGWLLSGTLVFLMLSVLTGCDKAPSDLVQGYVEGEYVYVASPYGGALATLSVRPGTEVTRCSLSSKSQRKQREMKQNGN